MLGPDPHGRDAGRVPLVRYGEVILRRAGADESAGNVEHLRELVHGAAKDLLGIEARPGALRDPVHKRLALRARLGLLDGERAVNGARDVLPHDHRKLDFVRDEIVDPLADEKERSDEAFARHERQRGEGRRRRESRQLLDDFLPHVGVRLVVGEEKRLPMIDDACAHDGRKGDGRIALPLKRRRARTIRCHGAKCLEHVVVHDEREGHVCR